jgi:hypothetical protein
MIEITEKQIDRINLLLSGITKGPEKAIKNVFDRALTTARSHTFKELSNVYAISKTNLRAETNVNLRKAIAQDNEVVGYLSFSGFAIPLYRFNVSPKTPTPRESESVSVGVLKGARTKFSHAFVAKMKSGHYGIFERLSGEYMKNRANKSGKSKHAERIGAETQQGRYDQFYGPSTAKMVENTKVITKIEAAAQETINKRIEQEISRILNGYGI